MSVIASQAQTPEGLSMGYKPAADPNSLAAGTQQPAGEERPAWLPENFKTPEDLAKSYKEAQSQNTRLAQELAALKKGGEKKDGTDKDGEVEKKLTDAGVPAESLNKWSEHFWQTGEVPPEAYDELAKVGITKDIIDDYAETKRTLQQGQEEALYNAGGGREQVEKIMEWAGTNLKPAEIDFFNSAFASGDLNSQLVAMEQLRSRYENAEGFSPSYTMSGPTVPSSDGSVFTSTAQVVEAMSDRRYQTDPAYRAAVEKKLQRSKVL